MNQDKLLLSQGDPDGGANEESFHQMKNVGQMANARSSEIRVYRRN